VGRITLQNSLHGRLDMSFAQCDGGRKCDGHRVTEKVYSSSGWSVSSCKHYKISDVSLYGSSPDPFCIQCPLHENPGVGA